MLTAYIRYADGTISRDTSHESLVRAAREAECVFWLDMNKPTDEEIAVLDDVFGFHPLAIEDTISYAQRPKIESYNHVGDAFEHGYFYMVFHGPDLETFREKLRTKELDLFVSERYLITIHEEKMWSVAAVMERAEADPGRTLDRGTDVLLYSILDHMVDHYQPILDYMQENLEDLEEQAVADPRPALLGEITVKKRELLHLRRIISPQRDIIAQLTRGEVPFIRPGTRIFFRDVQDHLIRTVEMIELYRDLILGARDMYLSSISNRLNVIMKTLTIITVVALPMTVVTSFFGMNFEGVPGWDWVLHHPAGFWGAIVVIAFMVTGLLLLFRWRKWI